MPVTTRSATILTGGGTVTSGLGSPKEWNGDPMESRISRAYRGHDDEAGVRSSLRTALAGRRVLLGGVKMHDGQAAPATWQPSMFHRGYTPSRNSP